MKTGHFGRVYPIVFVVCAVCAVACGAEYPVGWALEFNDPADIEGAMVSCSQDATGRYLSDRVTATVADGAFAIYCKGDGSTSGLVEARSRFMGGEVIDLVGAGDSFRAGLLSYLVRNVDAFRNGSLNVADCLQMGNLFASLYIKAPLGDRYANIKPYDELARLVSGDAEPEG